MPWIHTGLLYGVYLVVLGVYFRRLPDAPSAALVFTVCLSGLLEAAAFGCACTLLMAAGSLRAGPMRAAAHAIVVIVFTLACVVQGYALLLSNSFISVLALENASEAFLTASNVRNAVLAIAALLCVVSLAWSWHRPGNRLPRRQWLAFLAATVVCAAGVAALNAGSSIAGGVSHLGSGQSPFASLLRVAFEELRVDDTRAATTRLTAPESLCGVTVGMGQYPFLKDRVNDQPLPFSANRAVGRPNVIVLFVEGESARLLETYGGHYRGLTPNISRMAGHAMVVDNYFNHTAATFRGLQGALTSGFPLHGGVEDGSGWGEGNASSYAVRSYASLPLLLRPDGYQSIFFSPHKPSDAMTSLVSMLGFQDIYTATRSRAELLKTPEPMFHQPLTDRESFRSLTRYLQERKDAAPFFISLYSIDTHAFLDIPQDGIPYRDGSEPALNTLHTLDAEFGAFYDYFMSSRYAGNTILVLTVDHAHYAEPPYVRVAGRPYKPYFVDQVPLLIHAPWLTLPARFDAHGRTSLDLAPTILQMLDRNQVRNSFLGYSIFDRSHDRDFSVAAIGPAVYAIYHGQVYAPDEIPPRIAAGYARCRRLVKTYYANEAGNAIFPAGGENVIRPTASNRSGIQELDGVAAPIPDRKLAAASFLGSCELDRVGGQLMTPGTPLALESPQMAGGWVVDAAKSAPPQFTLLLRGHKAYGFKAQTGVPRPDVAQVMRSAAAGTAGFNVSIDPYGLPADAYEVMSLTSSKAGENQLCDMHRQLVVSSAATP